MPRLLDFLTGLYGLALFFWIGKEDASLAPVIALGAGLPALALLRYWTRPTFRARRASLTLSLVGLLAGGAAPLVTSLLMAIKVSLHSHTRPDYPPEVIFALLARLPLWAFAGFLLGLALALLTRLRPPPESV